MAPPPWPGGVAARPGGGWGGGLWRALGHRLGSQAGDRAARADFGLAGFLAKQAVYLARGFSVAAAAMAAAWVLGLGRSGKEGVLAVGVLAGTALFNIAVFRQGAYVHIYYQFYLAMPLALAAGMALGAVWRLGRGALGPAVALALLLASGVEMHYKLRPGRLAAALKSLYPHQDWLADYLRGHTEPTDRILLVCDWPCSFRQATYYADRNILVVPDAAEAERLWREGGFTKAFGLFWQGGWVVRQLFTSAGSQAPPRPPGRPPGRWSPPRPRPRS